MRQDSDCDGEEDEEEGGSPGGWRDSSSGITAAAPTKLVVAPPLRRDSSPSVRSAAESARSAESLPAGWTDEDNSPEVNF